MSQKCGKIKIILGCMYSGKTSEAIKVSKKWKSISKKVLCINYKEDNRYGNDDKLYSHDLNVTECLKVDLLSQIDTNKIINVDIILIDEGQFFKDLIEMCLLWCETYGKDIIVCGLDGDFQRKPFGKILELIPYADSVIKMNAFCKLCSDGKKGLFTIRLSNETEQVVIGSDMYIPVCRDHYVDNEKKLN